MDSLTSLFKYYGTDKEINGYTPYYQRHFEPMRKMPLRVAEIGIGTLIPNVSSSMVGYGEKHYRTGASLMAWRDYFENPASEIHGFDIQPDTQIETEARIKTHLVDSTKKRAVDDYHESNPGEWDIVIDDGCHYDSAQLDTVKNFWPYLKRGGYYIVEDIYPSSRLVTDFLSQFNSAVEDSPWVLSAKRNLLFVYKL